MKADPRSRFEFEYSFKGPYIAQTDGLVPFWSYHGHAIAGDENVRLAPSLRSRQGSSEFWIFPYRKAPIKIIQFGQRKCFPRNGLKSKSLLEYQEEGKLVPMVWQFGIRPKVPQHR